MKWRRTGKKLLIMATVCIIANSSGAQVVDEMATEKTQENTLGGYDFFDAAAV